jgi:predicted alpha/beta-fold hydrolase
MKTMNDFNENRAEDCFRPQPWARNPHLQTIFGSLRIRAGGRNPMLESARDVLLDGGAGVRLLGHHSQKPGKDRCPLVLLIHGWEGSSESTYMLSTGRYLFSKGCDILRLNLRDHGRSHHLNEGLFHGARIEEVFHAAGQAANLSRGPFFIAGFSLGGNFALRIALRASGSMIPNLREVFCISPSLDPHKATLAIDESPYRHYFLRKWKRSLRKKQALFPRLYDFTDVLKLGTCMDMTESVMKYYPEFHTYRDYFRRYTLTGDVLEGLSVPVTTVSAEDDPIISADDIRCVKHNGCLKTLIQTHGGHCGFLEPFPFGCWYERKIASLIGRHEVPS